MTSVTAQLNSLRIAPRKVRLVADLIKGLEVKVAEEQLRYFVKRGALPIFQEPITCTRAPWQMQEKAPTAKMITHRATNASRAWKNGRAWKPPYEAVLQILTAVLPIKTSVLWFWIEFQNFQPTSKAPPVLMKAAKSPSSQYCGWRQAIFKAWGMTSR